MAARVLIMPLAERSAGIGHLRRGAALAAAWPGASLAVPAVDAPAAIQALAGAGADAPTTIAHIERLHGVRGEGDLVVADRRSSSIGDLLSWGRYGTVVGLDEGGSARGYMPVLVDALPNLAEHPANMASVALLAEPPPAAPLVPPLAPQAPRRWLVSLGGDDSAHLSEPLVQLLLATAPADVEVAVVAGPRFGTRDWPPGARVLGPQPQLFQLLRSADVVFASFGLTAYESLACGVPIVLISPTRYHQQLARAARLPSLGLAVPWRPRRHRRLLIELLGDTARLRQPVDEVASEGRKQGSGGGLHRYLSQLRPAGPRDCPACGRRLSPVVARFPTRTYRRCRRCDLIHMLRFDLPRSYDRAYFFADYARQYGRTYLEDFQHIRATGYQRLRHIAALLPTTTPSAPALVDIGCAFGPFLDAARRRGWAPAGVDVSRDAVAYVRERLGLPALVGNVEVLRAADVAAGLRTAPEDRENAAFGAAVDAVTMWFVIEHVVDVGRVLQLVTELLRPGGVFAFSTPNGRGISGLRSQLSFLARSPEDHYTVWTARTARRVLTRYGFRIRRVRVTGHHPERFPFAAGPGRGRRLYRHVALRLSQLLGLGDTFEVYATTRGRA